MTGRSSLKATETNARHLLKVNELLTKLTDEILSRGFYGKAALEFDVADGTIQQIKKRVEEAHR